MSVRRFQFTPEVISDLHPCEVFVFGSNAAGRHYGGAAATAYQKFGALWGVGEGLRGQSYALPTLNRNMERVSVGSLKHSIRNLLIEVRANPDLTFLVTKIGCGIAGWTLQDVASAFWNVCVDFYDGCWYPYVGSLPENLVIPEEFYDYMPTNFRRQEEFNRINSDLLFIERQVKRISEAIQFAGDPEEYEHLHDELVEADSQRNALQEELREFIKKIV